MGPKRLPNWMKTSSKDIYLVIYQKEQVAWDFICQQLWQVAQSLNNSEGRGPFHCNVLNCHFQPKEGHAICITLHEQVM